MEGKSGIEMKMASSWRKKKKRWKLFNFTTMFPTNIVQESHGTNAATQAFFILQIKHQPLTRHF